MDLLSVVQDPCGSFDGCDSRCWLPRPCTLCLLPRPCTVSAIRHFLKMAFFCVLSKPCFNQTLKIFLVWSTLREGPSTGALDTLVAADAVVPAYFKLAPHAVILAYLRLTTPCTAAGSFDACEGRCLRPRSLCTGDWSKPETRISYLPPCFPESLSAWQRLSPRRQPLQKRLEKKEFEGGASVYVTRCSCRMLPPQRHLRGAGMCPCLWDPTHFTSWILTLLSCVCGVSRCKCCPTADLWDTEHCMCGAESDYAWGGDVAKGEYVNYQPLIAASDS